MTVVEHGHTFVLSSLAKEMFAGINFFKWLDVYGFRAQSRTILHFSVIDIYLNEDNHDYDVDDEEL